MPNDKTTNPREGAFWITCSNQVKACNCWSSARLKRSKLSNLRKNGKAEELRIILIPPNEKRRECLRIWWFDGCLVGSDDSWIQNQKWYSCFFLGGDMFVSIMFGGVYHHLIISNLTIQIYNPRILMYYCWCFRNPAPVHTCKYILYQIICQVFKKNRRSASGSFSGDIFWNHQPVWRRTHHFCTPSGRRPTFQVLLELSVRSAVVEVGVHAPAPAVF